VIAFLVINTAGIPNPGLFLSFSALSLGVGFRPAAIAANFVSGLNHSARPVVKVGDFVMLEGRPYLPDQNRLILRFHHSGDGGRERHHRSQNGLYRKLCMRTGRMIARCSAMSGFRGQLMTRIWTRRGLFVRDCRVGSSQTVLG